MTLPEFLADLERRTTDAAKMHATAPVADVLATVLEELRPLVNGNGHRPATTGTTWRERLWTAPEDTRLGVLDVAEAVGRPRSWVYRAVNAKRGADRLPARRLDGELVFQAGEVRAWLARQEQRG